MSHYINHFVHFLHYQFSSEFYHLTILIYFNYNYFLSYFINGYQILLVLITTSLKYFFDFSSKISYLLKLGNVHLIIIWIEIPHLKSILFFIFIPFN
jgi:hypothetical protein